MCGLLERFNPAVRTSLEISQGPLRLQVSRHSPYVPRIRTGVASDLLIHDVDLAIRLFGTSPVSVVARFGHFHETSEPGAEDVADALLGFPDGGVAALSASRLSHRKVRTMTITEIDREIEIDLLRQSITIYRHVAHPGSFDDPDGPGYSQQTIIDIPVIRHQGEPLVHQLEHFVDLVDGRIDAEDERRRILPPHRVVDAVRSAALTS
jgi:predicted dehydrogenase